ncbi:MAG: hypothetical protein RSG96_03170 [Clostridia bacterium]
MINIQEIRNKILSLEQLKGEKAEHDETVSKLRGLIANKEQEIATAILDLEEVTGVDKLSVLVGDRSYAITQKNFYTIPKNMRETAYPLLRELGHGDLIVEKVDDRTLSKELTAVAEEHGGELPPEYEPLGLSLYKKTDLASRKV